MKVSRKILALTDGELDEFLGTSKWGRLATANLEAQPHITPLGFVFHDGAIWFHALQSGRRARDLAENPKVAFLVDDGVAPGDTYDKRRGAILRGRCTPVAREDPALDAVRQAFMRAMDANSVSEIERRTHSWYRIEIQGKSSWDFGKIPPGTDRKLPARTAAAN